MVLHVLLQLLWLTTTALASSSIAKPAVCQDKCGDVDIPYPFGIGDPNCFMNHWYNVSCNTTFHPPRPYLFHGDIQVLEILLPEGQIRIDGWMAWDCYSVSNPGGNKSGASTNFTGTPYSFSDTRNKFTAIGCDTLAYIRGPNGTDFTTGCASICANKESLTNGSCSGIGCCQTSIPKGLQFLHFFLQSFDYHNRTKDFNPCSYAFLVDIDHFNFSIPLLSLQDFSPTKKETFPRVLDWVVGNETCQQAWRNSSTYACRDQLNSSCTDSTNGPGYRCNCKSGYGGNPYLTNGCKDINECELNPNLCIKGNCHNIQGGYRCIPDSTHFPATQVVIGVCISLVFLLVSGSCIYWGLRNRKLIKLKEKFFQQNGGLLLQQQIPFHESAIETTKIFTEEELKRATDNYDQSRIVGRGGSGTVYKGILSDHRIVAIKKSKVADGMQIEQFINEISILLQINHRNVVKLLGCCLETEVPLLVYEFISNGTLFHHFHGEGHMPSISWENRLRIAAEAAGAVAYLHSATSLPIIHRDIKSTNILLDENYTAKVSDFGASKLVPLDYTQITTLVQGTMGYLDPEYLQTSQLTEKSDVYSFGVVLVELLTGKKAVSLERSEDERNLSMYFISSMKENRLLQILDDRIVGEGGIEQIYAVAGLARRCLKVKGEERPLMKDVAAELDGLRRLAVHSWVEQNHEETQCLLAEPSRSYNSSHGVGEDSLQPQNLLELEMGREEIYKNKGEMALYVLLQLLWLTTALASSIAKPGCQDKCGNIAIPYPFGIGDPNCFINDWFNVTCNTAFDPPKPFLYLPEIEVLEILLQEGQIRLAGGMGWDCYSEMGPGQNRSSGSTNFTGTPYTFSSTQNIFTAIGCDTLAFIRGPSLTDFTTGCVSICANKERLRNGTCSGIGCCQTSIPEDLKYLQLSLQSFTNYTRTKDFSPCSYAFLVQKDYFNFSIPLISVQNFSDETKRKFPRVLDWVIGNEECEVARRNPSTYGCGLKSICNDSNSGGYRCYCPKGFEGNPYLPDACQDINECTLNPNLCIKGNCHNIEGGYRCIPDSTHFPATQVVIGVCISLVFLLVSGSCIHWGLRTRKVIKLKEKFFQQNRGLLLQQQNPFHESAIETTKIFTEEELKKATDNYDKSRIVGRGGSGTVYKGILSDHRIVAIKKSKVVDGMQIEQFINEIFILLEINHRNVVKLLGCCLETEVPLLVYEFISNGTLFHHFHGEDHMPSISWENRLRIAAEAAGAVAYLHSATSLPIIHRDIKSTNILLDENYTAKVSDFGASKLIHLVYTQITTLVQGTIGYLDPEYLQTSQLTEKSDVYSFGVVLVELLTGKKVVSLERSVDERNLSMYFISSMKENRLLQILDDRIVGEGGIEQLYAVAGLARRCLKVKGEERPLMKDVAAELDGLRRLAVHSWVEQNHEETQYLLAEPSRSYNSSHGVGEDSLRPQNLLELEMGR
ncbi:uncharacterized protein LOC143864967 [Tasmannia lanceolata]|uniref:uncharacterized protein LOC143864967 n=1 Tax=Tasmannia lanceolata TaxID=3420 RepID=UPI0040631B09